MNNRELFWRRVAEAREWGSNHATADDLQNSLRSPEFGAPLLTDPYTLVGGFDEWSSLSRSDKTRLQTKVENHRCSLVDALADRRAQMLIETGKHPVAISNDIAAQRFVVYLPDNNLADGAAAVVSHGYFDDDNVPPWDTWVMYVPADAAQPGKLISWVPPQLFKLVDDAVQVNPEECVYWATERELFPVRNL